MSKKYGKNVNKSIICTILFGQNECTHLEHLLRRLCLGLYQNVSNQLRHHYNRTIILGGARCHGESNNWSLNQLTTSVMRGGGKTNPDIYKTVS